MHKILYTFLLPALLTVFAAHAEECPLPPVNSAPHAVCLAKRFAENPKPEWTVGYEAKETKGHWLVYYRPTSRGVRGGGGDIQIEKVSGVVKLLRGYR